MSINFNVRKFTSTKLSFYSFNFTQVIHKYQRFASNFRTSFRMRSPVIQLNKSLDILKIFDKTDPSKVIHIIKESKTIKFNDLVSTSTYPALPTNFINGLYDKLLAVKTTYHDKILTYKVIPFEFRYELYAEKSTRKKKTTSKTPGKTYGKTPGETPAKITSQTRKNNNIENPKKKSLNTTLLLNNPTQTD